eukprot:TRINITY_DN68567_c0_g1_i1.p1 TRINITY_DN68567_c0_g1~~TRINITY_DN68567_c0_g1_i1.p1  ORF type:complete len:240 (-),score=74.95 TRINITY_DN68567_c0_g1_i1:121-810(-)
METHHEERVILHEMETFESRFKDWVNRRDERAKDGFNMFESSIGRLRDEEDSALKKTQENMHKAREKLDNVEDWRVDLETAKGSLETTKKLVASLPKVVEEAKAKQVRIEKRLKEISDEMIGIERECELSAGKYNDWIEKCQQMFGLNLVGVGQQGVLKVEFTRIDPSDPDRLLYVIVRIDGSFEFLQESPPLSEEFKMFAIQASEGRLSKLIKLTRVHYRNLIRQGVI